MHWKLLELCSYLQHLPIWKIKGNLPERTKSIENANPSKWLRWDYGNFSKPGISNCSCCSNQTLPDLLRVLYRKTNVLLSKIDAKQQQQTFAFHHVFRSWHFLHASFYPVQNAEVHQLLCFSCLSECNCLGQGSFSHRLLVTGQRNGGKFYRISSPDSHSVKV